MTPLFSSKTMFHLGTTTTEGGIAPPEGEMPEIEGPFWVVLVLGAVVRTKMPLEVGGIHNNYRSSKTDDMNTVLYGFLI